MAQNLGKVAGFDLGTATFQVAELNGNDEISYKNIRNCFIELQNSEQTEMALSQNSWQYIFDKNTNKYYVIGNDAMIFARMFPNKVELRRPMADGVLNKDEQQKLIILSDMLERTIGRAPESGINVITTCISSPSMEQGNDSSFHKMRLQGMVTRLGYEVNVIQQGMAIILAENPTMTEQDGSESKYSGLAISCGGGRTNAVIAYRGKQIVGASLVRGGDWINQKVSEATNTPISQVIAKKQKKFDFKNIDDNDDVAFALSAYFEEYIKYVFINLAKKFKQVKSEFPGKMQVVLGGGGCIPNGFQDKVKQIVQSLDFPFEIKCVRKSADPANSVVKGLLTHALASQKKKKKQYQQKKKQLQKKQQIKQVSNKIDSSGIDDII